MKRRRPGSDARDAQAGSTIALLLIDLLADPSSALYSCLRVCDLFCVRLTCKEAWRRIPHKVLTKNNLWETAFNGMKEPHIPMLRWCIRQRLHLQHFTTDCIGATGNMSLIDEFLGQYGRRRLVALFAGAVGSRDSAAALSLFPRLRPRDRERFDSLYMKRRVCASGFIEVAELIYPEPNSLNGVDLSPALQNGHLEFVQWVLSETELHPDVADGAISDAAQSGSIDLVRWLAEEHDCPMIGEALISAAWAGKLDMLKWLYQQAGGHLQGAVIHVARHGQLHVLDWLIEQGCQLTAETLYVAAEASTTATVAWLLDHGCPHVEETLVERACRNRRGSDVLKFLIETKRMRCNPRRCTREFNGSGGDEAVLHRAFGTPLSEDYFEHCVQWGDISRLRYALEHFAPLRPTSLTTMFERGECAMLYETLEFYSENGIVIDEFYKLLDRASLWVPPVHDEILEVLARFGYEPPEQSESFSE